MNRDTVGSQTPDWWRKMSTYIVSGVMAMLPGLWSGGGFAWGEEARTIGDSHPAKDVVVDIQARQFQPDRVPVPLGQKIRLVLLNQDAELHAFVPVGLFSHMTVSVSGNGAPQFGPEGLLRVLIPAEGRSEIVFIPRTPGVFPFLCDLPGHVMNGTIIVEE